MQLRAVKGAIKREIMLLVTVRWQDVTEICLHPKRGGERSRSVALTPLGITFLLPKEEIHLTALSSCIFVSLFLFFPEETLCWSFYQTQNESTFCSLKTFCPSMPVNFHLGNVRIPLVHASRSLTASRWLLNYRFGGSSYTFSDFAAFQLPVISAIAYKDGINSSVPQINLCWQTAWTA